MSSSENEQEIPSEDEVENAAEDSTDDEMTVCDDGATSDTDEEPAPEEPDVNASATESDEDDDGDEVDDDKDVPPPTKTITATSRKIESITNSIKERYEKRRGFQLYLRFPEKLPVEEAEFEKKIKQLSDLIIKGHRPRQKHARFCLVDFASTEDRDQVLEKLKKTEPKTKIHVSLPKTDGEDFIKELIEKRIQKETKRVAKKLLRKENKRNVTEKEYSSVIKVLNFPASVSLDIIKELFPDAVDIQLKPAVGQNAGKSFVIITLPSTNQARAYFRKKMEFAGSKLIVQFLNSKPKSGKKAKKPKAKQAKKNEANGAKATEKKASSPNKSESGSKKKPQLLPKKRPVSGNEEPQVSEKKLKTETAVNAKADKKGKKTGKGKKEKPFNKGKPAPKLEKSETNKPTSAPNKQPNGKKNNKQKKPHNKGKGKGPLAVTASK